MVAVEEEKCFTTKGEKKYSFLKWWYVARQYYD